jgi:L-threonylcarbamoyladenylate synthase
MGVVEGAVAAIRAGQPVVLPTDTVYGLCSSPYSEAPVLRAYRLKGRPEGQPSALLCSDVDVLLECLPELRGRAGTIARALLPGPYTLVLPNPGRRYRWLTGSNPDSIGVRVPELTGAAAEVVASVSAVMATSANVHGDPDPKTLDEVPDQIREACGALVDGGELPGTPSTVLDFTAAEPRVLREGAAPSDEAVARALAATS